MKQADNQLIKELLRIYKVVAVRADDQLIFEHAKRVHNGYINAGTIINDGVWKHVKSLFDIAYPDVMPGYTEVSQEEAARRVAEFEMFQNKS